jgi:ribosome maturation factor RimP
VAIRLADVTADQRRVQGVVESADDDAVIVRLADGTSQRIVYDTIDRARTVFEWGPQPKPRANSRSKSS